MLVEISGKLKNINELDPTQNQIDKDNIVKFLSDFDHTYADRSRPKGPDYLIIDNFAHFFQLDMVDLMRARSEAKDITD